MSATSQSRSGLVWSRQHMSATSQSRSGLVWSRQHMSATSQSRLLRFGVRLK